MELCVCVALAINLIDIKIHAQRRYAAINGIWRAVSTHTTTTRTVCVCVWDSTQQPSRETREWEKRFGGRTKATQWTLYLQSASVWPMSCWHLINDTRFNISHFAIAAAHIAIAFTVLWIVIFGTAPSPIWFIESIVRCKNLSHYY